MGDRAGISRMRIITIRWKQAAIFTLILICLFISYWVWSRNVSCLPASPHHPELQSVWYYCNALQDGPLTGTEGLVKKESFTLEAAYVVIRHGDRQSIHPLPSYEKATLPCDQYDSVLDLVPEVSGFLKVMKQNKGVVVQDSAFIDWKLYPKMPECELSYLTPIGVAQQVKNGLYLRERYLKRWNLLSDVPWDQVQVYATTLARTFQSSIAFMYGLLQQLDASKLRISSRLDNRMCAHETGPFPCTCTASQRFVDFTSYSFQQNRAEFFSQSSVQEAYKMFASVLQVQTKDLPRKPTHVMDISMVHVCHQHSLPGLQGQCVDAKAVKNIGQAISHNGQQALQNTTFQLISRLKMLPLLREILTGMEAVENGEKHLKFTLYSGHDSTIDSLSAALNISDGIWPKYATRLAFELYSTVEDAISGPKRYFFRVLYNGEDRTSRVRFCHGKTRKEWQGMCPLEMFKIFLKEGDGLQDLGMKSYKTACEKQIVL